MKYRCLVFDHDDTTVNSTATIHHPCFVRFLEEYYPGRRCSLEEYFIKNFSPGFLPMCREEYGMDDRMLETETLTLTRGFGRSCSARKNRGDTRR